MKKIPAAQILHCINDFKAIVEDRIRLARNEVFVLLKLKPYLIDQLLFGTLSNSALIREFNIIAPTENERTVRLKAYMDELYDKVSPEFKCVYLRIFNTNGNLVCPYCNMNSLSGASQLDHFKSKGVYPELAICITNLIPSCKDCNGVDGKHARELTVHPYDSDLYNRFDFRVIDGTGTPPLLLNMPPVVMGLEENIPDSSSEISTHLINLRLIKRYNETATLDAKIRKRIEYVNTHMKARKEYERLFFKKLFGESILGKLADFDKEEREMEYINKCELSKLFLDIKRQMGVL